MHQPLISVIIPFYNMEAFLAEAVESVRHQDYSNWELLLVDDGSTDKSREIAQDYALLDRRIKYLMHEGHVNKGLTASRNHALQSASGEYIALLDADDLWLPEKLSRQVAIAAAHPSCALIGGASLYWYSWQDATKEDILVPVGCETDKMVPAPQLALQLYPLGTGAAPCPCSLMIKTEALKKHKGFEEQFSGIYQMYEDQAFLSKLYLNEPCYMSSLCLDKYRQRPASLVSSVQASGRYNEVRDFFLKWLRNYLTGQKLKDPRIDQALKAALRKSKYPRFYAGLQRLNKILGGNA